MSEPAAAPATTPSQDKPKRICCACPETRKPRDECVTERGEEHCTEYIEAHKQCLRAEGFKVRCAHAKSSPCRTAFFGAERASARCLQV